ncbi:MAG TPA: metallophosphoesterase family protein [Candidatus Sulfotelmatobacter sp.]|nr:metallophosphoesterase family protein [Candidatus Sulfotelmatobacter sp.]
MLEGWPRTCHVEIPGRGDALFCHATPRNDTETFTHLTPHDRLLPIFDGLGVSVLVCGHTHMQFDRMVGTTRELQHGSRAQREYDSGNPSGRLGVSRATTQS